MAERLKLADIRPGLEYTTAGMVITEAHIVNFAGVSGDFFDVHMDDDFARSLGFERRVAHGLLCLSVIDGLKNRASVLLDAVASLEWHYRFKMPVVAGDRIQALIRVQEVRSTKQVDRGIVRLGITVTNQRGEIVQEGENTLMVLA